MGVAQHSIDILLTRLLWPVPRVRLETAKALARLIRSGNQDAASRLLTWISSREFESEATLGLGIIDGFDLSSHFSFTDVRDAVKVPSHLSDWLIRRNFASSAGLSTARYSYAPKGKATIPDRVRANFSVFNGVPRMFHSRLLHLEEMSELPFLARWQHEWEWLQAKELRGQGDPGYFYQGNREVTGQFDFADRETYVSAYLRTLAFAAAEWRLPHSWAEGHARAAMTLNRGLADVEPMVRPLWTDDILPGERDLPDLAAAIWASASSDLDQGHSIAALRAGEVTENGYVTYDFDRAIGTTSSLKGTSEPHGLSWSVTVDPANYAGELSADEGSEKMPQKVCAMSGPFDVGRLLSDIVPHVQLPPARLGTGKVDMRCSSNGVALQERGITIARWHYWYSQWEPATPKNVHSSIGFRATIEDAFLQRYLAANGLDTAVWCEVKVGTREYSYSEFSEQTESFWLML